MLSVIRTGLCLIGKIRLIQLGGKLSKWVQRLELSFHKFRFLTPQSHKILWCFIIIPSFFLSDHVQSQPNNSLKTSNDSLEIQNAEEQRVIPIMIWTEDRNPIKQVLGIDFGNMKLSRITENDSLSLVNIGLKLIDSVNQINTLKDLIRTFKDMYNTAFDSLKIQQDSSGGFEEEFHFVKLEQGLAIASAYTAPQNNLMTRRRRDQ